MDRAADYRGLPLNEAPRYLIRDRDAIYGIVVRRRLRSMGIRDKPISAGSPWQNCFAERLIGSIRRECVDHLVVFGEQHLRRALRSYARYYNEARTHRSLNKDAPVSASHSADRAHRVSYACRRTAPPIRKNSRFRHTQALSVARRSQIGRRKLGMRFSPLT